jgi:hypothetical protein
MNSFPQLFWGLVFKQLAVPESGFRVHKPAVGKSVPVSAAPEHNLAEMHQGWWLIARNVDDFDSMFSSSYSGAILAGDLP